MAQRTIIWLVILGAALALVFVHESYGPTNPARLANLYLERARAGDLTGLETLLRPGGMDGLVKQASEIRLRSAREVFARAMSAGLQKWAVIYERQLVLGNQAYQRAMSEIQSRARQEFGGLSEIRKEEVSQPAANRQWKAEIAGKVLEATQQKNAGDLAAFVDGRPHPNFMIVEGWAALQNEPDMKGLDRNLFAVNPLSPEFSVPGRAGEKVSIAGILRKNANSLTQIEPGEISTIAYRIGNQLVPDRTDIQDFCVLQGLTDEDRKVVGDIQFPRLRDRNFIIAKGKEFLAEKLRDNYGKSQIGVDGTDYSNERPGDAKTAHLLRGTRAWIRLNIVEASNGGGGNSHQLEFVSFRDRWNWKLDVNQLSQILWR